MLKTWPIAGLKSPQNTPSHHFFSSLDLNNINCIREQSQEGVVSSSLEAIQIIPTVSLSLFTWYARQFPASQVICQHLVSSTFCSVCLIIWIQFLTLPNPVNTNFALMFGWNKNLSSPNLLNTHLLFRTFLSFLRQLKPGCQTKVLFSLSYHMCTKEKGDWTLN